MYISYIYMYTSPAWQVWVGGSELTSEHIIRLFIHRPVVFKLITLEVTTR